MKKMNKKENKKEEVKISADEQELIFKGIRPEGMRLDVFKVARKQLLNNLKRYLGGQFKHISVNMDPKFDGKIESKGTYIRKENRRFEGIGRLWEKKMPLSQ